MEKAYFLLLHTLLIVVLFLPFIEVEHAFFHLHKARTNHVRIKANLDNAQKEAYATKKFFCNQVKLNLHPLLCPHNVKTQINLKFFTKR